LAIHTAGGAVWASLGSGCIGASCRERKTLVLDPRTLATTATLTGAVVDVAVSGTRAYALFSFPDEVRGLNIADPQHPFAVATRTAPASATSIAYANGKVFVLAGKVFGYSEATLTEVEQHLTAIPTKTSQQIRIDGTCALVSRDGDAPLLYDLPTWTLSTKQFAMPSAVQMFATQPSLLLFLTEHSLELAYPANAPAAPRRRALQ
jgi:hypothetical protein